MNWAPLFDLDVSLLEVPFLKGEPLDAALLCEFGAMLNCVLIFGSQRRRPLAFVSFMWMVLGTTGTVRTMGPASPKRRVLVSFLRGI